MHLHSEKNGLHAVMQIFYTGGHYFDESAKYIGMKYI